MSDKLKKLVVYQESVKSKLSGGVPDKHKQRPAQFRAFWEKELSQVSAQIEAFKLEGVKGVKGVK